MLLTDVSNDAKGRQAASRLKDVSEREDTSMVSRELKLSLVRYYPTGYYFGTTIDHKRSGFGMIDLQTTPGYYQGQFEDDLMHGVGLLQIKGKPTYLGSFADGLPSGTGAQFCSDFTHIGSFLFGGREGIGETFTQRGIRIIGNFTSAGLRGYGEIKDVNNHVAIQGTFQEGKLEGLVLKSGPKAKYFGYFKEGMRHGPGVMYDHSGNLLSAAIYESGSFTRYGMFPMADYEGQVDATGQPEGWGRETKGYVGEYSRGLRHGLGKQTSSDGQESYTGQWVNSSPEGVGYLATPTESYFGNFKRGLKDGFGYEVSAKTNREYLGYYAHGVKHGVAIVRIPGKQEKAARFASNKLVEILPDSEAVSLRTSSPLDFRAFAGQADAKLQKILRFLESQNSRFAGLRSAEDIEHLQQRLEGESAELEAAVAEQKAAFESIKDTFDMVRYEIAACLGDGAAKRLNASGNGPANGDGLARIRVEEAARYRGYLREMELSPAYLPVEEGNRAADWASPPPGQPQMMIEMSAFSFDKDFGNLALAPGGLLDSSPTRRQMNSRDYSSLASPNRDHNHSGSRLPRSTSREDSVEFVDGPMRSKPVETSKEAPNVRVNYRSFQNYMLDAIFPMGLEELGKSDGMRMDLQIIGGRNIDLELLFCPDKATTQFFKADHQMPNFDVGARSFHAQPLESLDRVEFSTPHRKSPSVDHYIGLIDRLEVVPPSQSTDRLLQASTQAVERHSKPGHSKPVEAPSNPRKSAVNPESTQIPNLSQPTPDHFGLQIPNHQQHPGEVSSRTLEQFEFDPLDLPPPPASKPTRNSIAAEQLSQDGVSESMPSVLGKDTIPESDDILPVHKVAVPPKKNLYGSNIPASQQTKVTEPEGTRTSFGHKMDPQPIDTEKPILANSDLQQDNIAPADKSSREKFAAKRAEAQKQTSQPSQTPVPPIPKEAFSAAQTPVPDRQAKPQQPTSPPAPSPQHDTSTNSNNGNGTPTTPNSTPPNPSNINNSTINPNNKEQSKDLLDERTRLEKLKIQLEIELLKVQLDAVRKEKDIYEGKPADAQGLGYTYQPPEKHLDLP